LDTGKKLIYVAGPLTQGDTIGNVRRAALAGHEIMQCGHAAYVPHLSVVWDWIAPQGYEDWMDLDFTIIRRCDGLLRLRGECPGCEREVELAEDIGIPVFHGMPDLKAWLRCAGGNNAEKR
jgi:hypothetical protein